MSLEDLPNDLLGVILRKAEGFDKIRLTQVRAPLLAPSLETFGALTFLFICHDLLILY